MVYKSATIILGAGASKEVNMPTGEELKDDIVHSLDFSIYTNQIRNALGWKLQGEPTSAFDVYIRGAERIRNAMPQAPSIDHFIDSNRGDEAIELCGKLAIVHSILRAEKGSQLYFDRQDRQSSMDFNALDDTWFNMLFHILTENCQAKHLEARLSKIKLVVFNYDRCIEHFLYYSLQNYYDIQPGQAAVLVASMEIHHPYGIVGNLPWMGGEHIVAYGADLCSSELLGPATKIKTFTEGVDPSSSEIDLIRQAVADTDLILFLGFAYHPMNLELISPLGKYIGMPISHGHWMGTGFGLSAIDCRVIESDLAKRTDGYIDTIEIREGLKCFELFKEYRRSLSLSQYVGPDT